jgi:hypothetical protein
MNDPKGTGAGVVRPDLDWYIDLSRRRGEPPRCPFSNVPRCPRYYSSLWLIGEHGGSTQIEPELDKMLLDKWEDSDLWPTTKEQETRKIPEKFWPRFSDELKVRDTLETSRDSRSTVPSRLGRGILLSNSRLRQILGRDEGQSRNVLGCVVSARPGKSLAGTAEPELDVEVGGPAV